LSGNERYAEVLKQGDDAYGFAQALQNLVMQRIPVCGQAA